jgi:hypothetical protein
MLASGTQDRGFVPDRSRRIFHNEKIHSTQSFDLSVFRLIPEQFQTNKVHDTSKIGQKKSIDGDFRVDLLMMPCRLIHSDVSEEISTSISRFCTSIPKRR